MMITVKVRAGAKKRSIVPGKEPNTFSVHTPKAPEDGKANKDLVDIIAEHFHVPKSHVEIMRGHTNSVKQIKIMAR
ncbi:MAG: hypothetical protein RLZZ324_1352 [Candidatus Parcubacteria bacterium]|jgi:uncharacterized protein (TIGR00251 family)